MGVSSCSCAGNGTTTPTISIVEFDFKSSYVLTKWGSNPPTTVNPAWIKGGDNGPIAYLINAMPIFTKITLQLNPHLDPNCTCKANVRVKTKIGSNDLVIGEIDNQTLSGDKVVLSGDINSTVALSSTVKKTTHIF